MEKPYRIQAVVENLKAMEDMLHAPKLRSSDKAWMKRVIGDILDRGIVDPRMQAMQEAANQSWK
jgi:hypothetical protein